MGIRGITAIIKKHCPECLRPSSLADYSEQDKASRINKLIDLNCAEGKAIAIDGNLLSQRFHHGSPDTPLIVSWYRFLMNIRERHEIRPICVFDGPTRLPQKEKELAKRQASKALTLERAAFETQRSNKVDAFATALPLLATLPKGERTLVAKRFHEVFSPSEAEFGSSSKSGPAISPISPAAPSDEGFEPTLGDLDPKTGSIIVRSVSPVAQPEAIPLPESPREISQHRESLSNTAQDLMTSLEESLRVTSLAQGLLQVPQSPTQTRLTNVQHNLHRSAADLLDLDETPENAAERLEELTAHLKQLQIETAEIAQKYTYRSTNISSQDVEDVKALINAMGIPLIVTSAETPHEAEALASALFHAGIVDMVMTEDSDVLMYDASMLRNATGFKSSALTLNGKEVRDALGLDRDQFIDFGLLCGSDFAETIHKLGPSNALKLIKTHGSIEEILQSDAASPKPKWHVPDLNVYLTQICRAREVFHSPPPIPVDAAELQQRGPSPELAEMIKRFDLTNQHIPDGDWQHATDEGYFGDQQKAPLFQV